MEAFMFFQPRLHFWMLVSDVVVNDQVQLKVLGCFSIDFLEKFQPLLMPVLIFNTADQASLKIVQRGEQPDGAVAYIIVRLRADMADAQRQPRLGAFKCLHLAFFIKAEHQRLVRRVQVESDNVPEFLFKIRVIGQFEGASQVRFQVIGRPEFVHAGSRNSSRSCHASAAPSRFTDARLKELLKNTVHSFKGQKRFTTSTWFIEQTEPLTPASDYEE